MSQFYSHHDSKAVFSYVLSTSQASGCFGRSIKCKYFSQNWIFSPGFRQLSFGKRFITLASNITSMMMTWEITTAGHYLFCLTSWALTLLPLGNLVLNHLLGISLIKCVHPSITSIWLWKAGFSFRSAWEGKSINKKGVKSLPDTETGVIHWSLTGGLRPWRRKQKGLQGEGEGGLRGNVIGDQDRCMERRGSKAFSMWEMTWTLTEWWCRAFTLKCLQIVWSFSTPGASVTPAWC